MEAADERGQHMAVSGVIVVAGPVEIGGHQADGIKAVLTAQGFRELDAGDFGDGVPLIGGLQGACEQCFFADRLLGEFGVDTAAAEKQQPAGAGLPGRFHNVGLDAEVL